jgi:hypothetical protein
VRRVRPTKRPNVPDLPRRRVDPSTVGRTFESPDGKIFQDSMFVTLTCRSYGWVGADGSPINPDRYDYRSAARDLICFAAGFDRWVQNLRRADGRNVQYFAVLEMQRRMALLIHHGIRGAVSRQLLRQVTAGTYYQRWWPPTDVAVYPAGGAMPVWDEQTDNCVDPHTSQPLTRVKPPRVAPTAQHSAGRSRLGRPRGRLLIGDGL